MAREVAAALEPRLRAADLPEDQALDGHRRGPAGRLWAGQSALRRRPRGGHAPPSPRRRLHGLRAGSRHAAAQLAGPGAARAAAARGASPGGAPPPLRLHQKHPEAARAPRHAVPIRIGPNFQIDPAILAEPPVPAPTPPRAHSRGRAPWRRRATCRSGGRRARCATTSSAPSARRGRSSRWGRRRSQGGRRANSSTYGRAQTPSGAGKTWA